MHFVKTGQGHPVILIHGLLGNLDNLKTLGAELSKQYQVYRLDLPNHGLSPHKQTLNYQDLAVNLARFIEQQQLNKPHLIGHSMGGKVALACALTYPQLISSVTAADIAPVTYPARHLQIFNALKAIDLNQLKTRVEAQMSLISAGIDLGTCQFLLKNLYKNEDKYAWRMDLDTIMNQYPQVIGWPFVEMSYQGPCLFVKGGDSDYIVDEYRTSILKQFPHCQAKIIANTGHWLHSQKPTTFNMIVSKFLASVDNEQSGI